ncbi:hypothetical protein QN277_023253 [Acacia crassicarpa]|uniref:UV-B-induced protein At3g17800, chloroplastic-like n=1 Tax=Acacia crassicarpa TaxID=499986 RepID=A0AAE1JLB9_9FABA|nr:hypothetical protein QN277_023253 [Acacia crassicarpa]
MERCLYHPSPTLAVPRLTYNLTVRPISRFISNLPRKPISRIRPSNVVKASAGANHCEFSSLNSPLEPKSHVGRFLSGVLLNHRQMFHVAVSEELKLLVDDRDAAVARMALTAGSDEDLLHRRIAQMKEHECEIAVQDVMSLLIFYKFSEIRVPLVPKLSKCTYNGRLEILPSKDWELESIYSVGILDLIREHVTSMTGLKAKSSVTESWATTEIQEFLLARIYVASILYGYFLKSMSLRYHLERSLSVANHDDHRAALTTRAYEIKDVIFGHMGNMQSVGQGLIKQEEEVEDIKCYMMGFNPGLFERCAKLRSKEAVNLVESYSMALFGNEESGLIEGNNNVILTSFSTLKRLVLEAVAFGSFLWETEDYIDSVYKLRDN